MEYHSPACALVEGRGPCDCVPHIPGPVDPKDARIAELGEELAEIKLKYDILAQADVYGHPDHETVCGDYPECMNDWLAGLIAWMREFDDMDPSILCRWDKRSTP